MSKMDSYTPALGDADQAPVIDKAKALAKYNELCAIEKAVDAEVFPLVKKLEKASLKAEEARIEATAIAEQLRAARGGPKWFKLKKEIGILAKVTTGVLPPTTRDLELAAQILGVK